VRSENLIAWRDSSEVGLYREPFDCRSEPFGPFDTRLTDDNDRLGHNGVNATTTTADGRHYEWHTTMAVTRERELGSRQLKSD
jgi:hypothetical protein